MGFVGGIGVAIVNNGINNIPIWKMSLKRFINATTM